MTVEEIVPAVKAQMERCKRHDISKIAVGLDEMQVLLDAILGGRRDVRGEQIAATLTRTERKIVRLFSEGNTTSKELAIEMRTSEQVIKNYLRGIFDKTGTYNRPALMKFLLEHPGILWGSE